jgi:hypothetical protein
MLQTKMTEILGIKYPIQCGTVRDGNGCGPFAITRAKNET